jgi:DNA topoisomerase IA
MELSMRQISDGTRTKEEVLEENIAMYQEALRLAKNQFGTLRQVCTI